jgi:hypothetical protein
VSKPELQQNALDAATQFPKRDTNHADIRTHCASCEHATTAGSIRRR